MNRTNPPAIRSIANLWSLWDYPTAKRAWSLERQFADIAEAGFDGITTFPTKKHAQLAEKHDLSIVGYFGFAKSSEFRTLIQQNLDAGAVHINVQLGADNTPVAESIRLSLKLMQESEKLGAKCAIEVHRGTCTETPEKLSAIATGYRKATGRLLPITWDFSHLSVVKHLDPSDCDRLLVNAQLIQHAQQFHLRPFNGQHCQLPVTDGHGEYSSELKEWLPFVEKVLSLWLKGNQGGRELFIVPEMGPIRGGYNLAQLPNSWDDAKVLRPLLVKAWNAALASQPARL